ncbi:hypothetical protein HanXRQr2_Chr08g0340411 [Helianthus annuus]|uniref:Uncharacterized protein n=1 Tax=Helianthus annuus TaxID=4232 RepID=A0A251U5P9_HELAN|nr:hypothetical protein HanXRQr2_Chr08g0340411 [Helianthus annuus]KAJ0547049.1 hypothetical protein HanIR_Chr08g0367711 [Helianthus annuus]KAJ0628897.1 hypothetical protein HanIR_Chr00c40g0912811 [Helianthus annuus]KAJ0719298.1 hypothetical protein HanLR1_Chr08g0280111 [Helianthus annuus]KAJ0722530.1 hypothetical protein HanOQP8_Chr08g0287651 [Helianthus annuus]
MSSKSPSILLFLLLLTVAVAVTTARTPSLCSSFPVSRGSRGSCSIRCIRWDPVCGVNNVTYGCGCPEARCYGVRVVKLGPCET